jgi:hypothetical protein
MTTYNRLKKIIPPDQALGNQALSRSLRQVKDIFDTDLPAVAEAVSQLESNKDLDLINELTTPIPTAITNFIGSTLATGTGPGNTVTTNDVIGIAAGATATIAIADTTNAIANLASLGALNNLTANGGTATSSVNGVYTVMQYCLAGDYTTSVLIDPGPPPIFNYTITIPAPLPGQGTYGPNTDQTNVTSLAFDSLIASANAVINSIASGYPDLTLEANQAFSATAAQLELNINNSIAAGIDIANVVNDIANANLVANSVSTVLGLTSQLHDLGLDVSAGGSAQFFENIANTQNITGQAVIASMREGRNIAVLNAAGIQLDTQLVDINPNTTVANNLQDGQYSVAEARANIII